MTLSPKSSPNKATPDTIASYRSLKEPFSMPFASSAISWRAGLKYKRFSNNELKKEIENVLDEWESE